MKQRFYFLAILFFVKHSASAQTLFSEDFSAGIPAGWTNVDNSGNNILWRTTTTGALAMGTPVDEQLSTSGTSAANGYLILDSDSAGLVNEDAVITTTAINCSGFNIVRLSFNEYFAQYNTSSGKVQVSNDGVSWNVFHHADQGLTQDSGTANPNFLDIDISATAANQSTVYIRFSYQGNYDYWWFVDDIRVYSPLATDLSVDSVSALDTAYTLIPFSQSNILNVSGIISNTGLNTTTSGTALLELIDSASASAIFSETVNLPQLAPGNSQVVTPSSMVSVVAPGTYFSRITVTVAGDGDATNDVGISLPIHISDSVFARDDGTMAGIQYIGSGAGQNGIAGQNFRISSPDDLTSITFFLKDTFSFNAAGTPLYFSIYPQLNDTTAPDNSTALATSETLLLFNGTIPAGGSYFTLEIQGGSVHLNPGLYFIGFHEDADLIPMGYSNNIFSHNAVWAYWDAVGWVKPEDFGFSLSYMIRANFGQVPDAIADYLQLNNDIIYPNPATENITIQFSEVNENHHLIMSDAVGKIIRDRFVDGTMETKFNMNDLSDGIYLLQDFHNGKLNSYKVCKNQ